jgi:hypothetical protein
MKTAFGVANEPPDADGCEDVDATGAALGLTTAAVAVGEGTPVALGGVLGMDGVGADAGTDVGTVCAVAHPAPIRAARRSRSQPGAFLTRQP